MRFSRSFAAFAIALVCAMSEPARAAPATSAAPTLVDTISADRGRPMTFNTQREAAGENVLRLLADDVNTMLRATTIDAEHELIRAAADLAVTTIAAANTSDFSVRYSIAGSVRETGVRSLSVNVESTRLRGSEPRAAARNVEPWTPKKSQSPTARSRAQREGSSAGAGSSAPSESSSTSGESTRGESG